MSWIDKSKFPEVDQSVHDKYQKLHDEIESKVLSGKAIAMVGNASKCAACGKVSWYGWALCCKCGGNVEHGFLVMNDSVNSSFVTIQEFDAITLPILNAFSGEVIQ